MIFSKKTESPDKPKSEVKLIPILKAEQLLASLRSQSWLKNVKGYLNLPDEIFDLLYVQLIEKFAEFVQVLPMTVEGKLGGLLSESLARAILALKALYKEDAEKFAQDPRYCYTLFTAGLLMNIGAVTNSKVTLCTREGHFIADWNPYEGSLLEKGIEKSDYYKLHRYNYVPIHLSRHTTTILARQLMSKIGFSWLTEDIRLFHMWLALLNDDRANAGGLDLLLSVTPEEIENAFELEHVFLFDEVELITPFQTQEAENFLTWLQNEIDKGNLAINTPDANIAVVKEGVFLSMDLFREFCNAYSAQHYTVLAKAFNYLGLTELSGSDFKFLQYFEKDTQHKKQKISFKSEDAKNFHGSFLKESIQATLHEVPKKEGVLLKSNESRLIFKEPMEISKHAQLTTLVTPASAKLPQINQKESFEPLKPRSIIG